MKLVIQRVKSAKVEVEDRIVSEIDKGFLVFIGITHEDNKEIADYLVKKMCNLRIFEDENNKMNKNIKEVEGELLIVSQFTLYANCKKGNRPSFTETMEPNKANELYEYFCEKTKKENIKVKKGIFGADMQISLKNNGPVTIILEKEQMSR